MTERVEYQYMLTCPECGGVTNCYSEKILHPGEILKIEQAIPDRCILCRWIKDLKNGEVKQ